MQLHLIRLQDLNSNRVRNGVHQYGKYLQYLQLIFVVDTESAQWTTPPRHLGTLKEYNLIFSVQVNYNTLHFLYSSHLGLATEKD